MEGRIQIPIPNKLRVFRKKYGFKQRDIAAILGLRTATHVVAWERGYRLPCTKQLIDLSLLYRTFPNELYPKLFKESTNRIRLSEKEYLGLE